MKTSRYPSRLGRSPLVPVIVVMIGAVSAGYLLTASSPFMGMILVLLLIVFASVFIWPEAGLYLIIFSMLFSPELMGGGMGGKGTLGRGLTLRLEDFLLAFVGLSWFARTAVDKGLGLFRRTPLNQPIAAYITVCFLATLWGKMTGHVHGVAGFFFVLKYFEFMVVFFMVVNYVDSEDQAKRLLLCLFVTCFIVSIYGIMQIPGGGRISAPFEGERGEPNTFGGYLVFMGAIVMALLDHLKNVRVRYGLVGLLIVLLISLLYTQSRASYLALIPTYFVLALFSPRRFFLIAGLIVVFAVGPLILPRVVKERISYTFKQRESQGQIQVGRLRLDTSTSARVISWQEGLQDWKKKPILGYGVTGYGFMDAQYPRILVETGIVGMLTFGWLIYAIFQIGFHTGKEQGDDLLRGLSVGLLAGLVGLLFHAIGANTFIIVRIMEPFWCLVGIVVALSSIKESPHPSPST